MRIVRCTSTPSLAQNRMRLRQQLRELHQDVAISLRQLRRGPGFAVIATITLALGVGSTTAVFAVVDSVMLRPLPFRAPSELFLIERDRPALSLKRLVPDRRPDHPGTVSAPAAPPAV